MTKLNLISHYQFPVCPEWEDLFLVEIKDYKTRVADSLTIHSLEQGNDGVRMIKSTQVGKSIIIPRKTGLIVDTQSIFYGSVIYGVNTKQENFFWLVGRGLQEIDYFGDFFHPGWSFPHNELRFADGEEHRNLGKTLHSQI